MKLNKLIWWTLITIVVGVPLFLLPQTFSVYELPKVALFRSLTLVATAILLISTVLSDKTHFPKIRREDLFLWLSLGCYVWIFALGTFFSIEPHISFWGSYERQQGLLTFFHYLLFFLSVVAFFRTKHEGLTINKLIKWLCFGALAVSIYGLYQSAFTPVIRIYSTIGQTDFLANYLIMILPFFILSIYEKKSTTPKKVFWIISALIVLSTIIITGSRAAIIGLLVGLIIFAVIYKKLKLLLIPASVILAVIILNIFNQSNFVQQSAFFSRFVIQSESFDSAQIRLYIWPAAIDQITAKPFLGYGPEMMSEDFPKYADKEIYVLGGDNETTVDRAHNELLDITLSLGIFGLLAYLTFLFLLFRICRAHHKNPTSTACLISLAALFTANIFSFSTTVHNMTWWLIVAIIFALLEEKNSYQNHTFRLPSGKVFKTFSILFILTSFGYLIYEMNIKTVTADHQYNKGIQKMVMLQHPQASDYFSKALEQNPHEITYAIMGAKHAFTVAADAPAEVKNIIVTKGKFFLETAKDLAKANLLEIDQLDQNLQRLEEKSENL